MFYRRSLLNRSHPADRLAITLLRGGRAPYSSDSIVAAFARLRGEAADHGMHVLPPDAPSIGSSESLILGWIAAHQRMHPELIIGERDDIPPSIGPCATLLMQAGHRLDYRHVARVYGGEDQPSGQSATSGVRGESARQHVTSTQRRILDALTANGAMRMQDLTRLGVSRQTVTMMYNKGLLNRLKFGLYAAAKRGAEAGEH